MIHKFVILMCLLNLLARWHDVMHSDINLPAVHKLVSCGFCFLRIYSAVSFFMEAALCKTQQSFTPRGMEKYGT